MKILKVRYSLFIIIASVLLNIFFFNAIAHACTGVYVGSEACDEGTSLIARSSDDILNVHTSLKIYGGKDGIKIKKLEDDNGFVYEFGDTLYRCICSPTNNACDDGWVHAFSINEFGVSVSATVTAYCSPQSLQFNPLVDNGLSENVIPLIIGTQVKSAREGINLIIKLIDEHGSCGNNILMISDQNECWYMEIYGGHQYCAIKAPNDCVACIGNEFAITTEYKTCEEAICSPQLFDLPKTNNFAVYDADGSMNIFDTYAGKDRYFDFSHLRTWGGHHLMAPSSAGIYNTKMRLPLFYKPDKKVSVANVADIFRYRYEDTDYCPEKNNRDDIRVIASETQTKTHILQTYKDVDPAMSCIAWYSPDCPEFGNFVPLSNSQTSFADSYTYEHPNYELENNSASSVLKQLSTICGQNRKMLSAGVKSYWKLLEKYENFIVPDLIKKGDTKTLNDFCKFMEEQTYSDAKRLKDDVLWFLMSNTNTFSKDKSYKTLEYFDTETPIYTSSIDVSLFAKITGWNIDEANIRDVENTNKTTEPGLLRQDYVGEKQGYLKLSKNGKSIEIVSSDGHASNKGQLIIDGKTSDIDAVMSNDRMYGSIELINVLCDNDNNYNDYSLVTNNPTQFAQQSFSFFALPNWAQTVCIVLLAGIIFSLIYFIRKAYLKKKPSLQH